MIKYNFICDLEFTEMDPMRGQIIECALLVTDLNLNVINEFYAKVRPEIINHKTWSLEAQKTHKITPEQAMGHPYGRREFCMALLNFLAPYYFECGEPQPFVCHAMENGWYKDKVYQWPYIDYFMLDWHFRYEKLQDSLYKIMAQDRLVSTIRLAKDSGLYVMREITDKNGKKSNRKSYKLNLLCDLIGFDLKHHAAFSDAYGCLEILKHCKTNKGLLECKI